MLLVFPTFQGMPVQDEEVYFVRSLDKDRFNSMVAKKLAAGWTVHEMTSSFRKTRFGGSTAYYAEMRLSGGSGKEKKRKLSGT